MIKSFRHKGLEAFYRTGSRAGIQPQQAARLRIVLTALDHATGPKDMDAPTFRLHGLTGDLEGFYSVKVNGNWRVIFRFIEKHAELVDYLDYH